jgi:hypothetical protein
MPVWCKMIEPEEDNMPTQLEELKKTLTRLQAKGGPDNAFRQGLRIADRPSRAVRPEKGTPAKSADQLRRRAAQVTPNTKGKVFSRLP